LNIAGLTIDPPLILAPMAGITDSPFRRVVHALGGCGLVMSEFLSSEALVRHIEAELGKLCFDDQEHPLGLQVYGSRPDAMAEAARMVEATGADLCDLNMGCPARKIVRGCAGVALMGDLELARRIIAAVRRSISMPLTVKFRSGLDATRLDDLELGRICEGEGVDAVTLHPRTGGQQYGGRADWGRIAALKERLSIPVIGNGDVREAADALEMLRETGCDAVMIGRAAVANPWIFRQASQVLDGRLPAEPPREERRQLVSRLAELLAESYDERGRLHKLKVFIRSFSHGLAGGRKLRQRLSQVHDADQLAAELEAFLA
jgi:nifR3 family TIM-barrel protein